MRRAMSRNAKTKTQPQQRHKQIGSLEPYGNVRSIRNRFEAFYRRMYPDADRIVWTSTPGVHKPDLDYAEAGIDALVFFPIGRTVTIAELYRQKDYGDMLIEVWSDAEKRFPGWAIDDSRHTMQIAYAVDELQAVYWLPFRTFQRACSKYLQQWIDIDNGYPHISRGRTCAAWYAAVPWRLVSDAMGIEPERMLFPW